MTLHGIVGKLAIVVCALACAIGFVPMPGAPAAVSVTSVKSGDWSDPAVWSTGAAPQSGDAITVSAGDSVSYDLADGPVYGETTVLGTLSFAPRTSTLFQIEENLLVKGDGRLVMKPSGASVVHILRFVNVDNRGFVGGGMDPLPTDVGLWVMDGAQLDIAGTPKLSWTNLTEGAAAGASAVATKDAPSGWQVGDRIAIAPTEAPTRPTFADFDEATIASVADDTVRFEPGLARPHPQVNGQWTAEIMNLTRNARIEGTPGGKSNAHIFIRSSRPQYLRNLELRYMGVFHKTATTGRYAVHFHHAGDGSRGSLVEGVVVRNANSHSFVAHNSDGVTFRDDIAYNVKEDPFWWDQADIDPTNMTNDTVYDRDIAARVGANDAGDRLTGFFLPLGFGNSVRNSVGVGIQGRDGGGYFWENGSAGVWEFQNNVAHNNIDHGIAVWQNSEDTHVIDGFTLYYNGSDGINHGAYANSYVYKNGVIYGNGGNGITLAANSAGLPELRFENIVVDGAGISPYAIEAAHSAAPGVRPTVFLDMTLRGYSKRAILMSNNDDPKRFDFENSTFDGGPGSSSDIAFGPSNADTTIRIQPASGPAIQVTPGAQQTIGPFLPTIWGNGNGLLAEYFNEPDFTDPAYARVEPTVNQNWQGVGEIPFWLYKPDPVDFSVRWSGEIQAQFDETYTFTADCYGEIRAWVGGEKVIDTFASDDPGSCNVDEGITTPIALKRGEKYPIRVEVTVFKGDYFTRPDHRLVGGVKLMWQSASQPRVLVPQTQLSTSSAVPAPVTASNRAQ